MRHQLNEEHYQQAVKFAENFTNAERQELLNEIQDRHNFEQQKQAIPHLQKSPKKVPLVLGSLALIGLLCTSFFYWQSGRYQQVQQGEQAFVAFQQQKAEESSVDRNDHYILNLQKQLRQNPNNGDLWFELGQAYSLNNDFESAMICYQNAITVLGRKPSIIGSMATADYYLNKQKLSPQAKSWIEEALKSDPQESASLLLLASDAFLHNDLKQAIDYWEQVLDSENQAIDRKEIIKSIQMAQNMLKGS